MKHFSRNCFFFFFFALSCCLIVDGGGGQSKVSLILIPICRFSSAVDLFIELHKIWWEFAGSELLSMQKWKEFNEKIKAFEEDFCYFKLLFEILARLKRF